MAGAMSYQGSFKNCRISPLNSHTEQAQRELTFTGILVRFYAQKVLDKQVVMIEVVY